MLKSAATKLAHNPATSAFAGNKALRPLQDLITAEKAIITSLGQLSIHFSRASEALRVWGHGEGEDLSDTLGASTKLLLEYSLSLRNFAAHEQTIREHMKAIRTHEENLDKLRSRRKTVASKADSAERKLNKMDPVHKDVAAQSNLLEQLRDTIRELDSEIMTAEAKLGDLKRTATKAWMILKFGGLEECCRKGLIVSESGKRIMAELPQESTAPGFARSIYVGNARTEAYVADALSALGEVSIDPSAPSGRAQLPPDANYQDGDLHAIPSSLPNNDSSVSLSRGGLPGDGDEFSQYRGRYDSDAPRPSLGGMDDFGRLPADLQADEGGVFPSQPDVPHFQSFNSRKPPSSSYNNALGDYVPSVPQQIISPTSTGGRFATFPVKGKRQDSAPPMIAEPLVGSRSTFSGAEQAPPKGDTEDVPRSEAIEGAHTPPLRPPPGAAPPALPSTVPYGGYGPGSYDSGPPFVPDEKEGDSQLAYMVASERKVPFGSRPLPVPRPLAQPDREAATIEAPLALSEGESTPLATAQPPVFNEERTLTPPPAVDDLDDERALNAAAAREVSRELDSLMYQPPTSTVTPRDSPPQTSAPTPLSIPPVASSPPRSSSDSVAPPPSPFTRPRGRGSKSPEAPRSSTEQSPTSIVSPPPYATSVPSSPTQQAPLPPPNIAAGLPSSPSLSGVSSPPYRTPPEVPSSPTTMQRTLRQPLAMSHSAVKVPLPPHPRSGTGMISVAAFRRPAPPQRAGSEPQSSPGSQDVSPLSIKKKDLRNSSNTPRMSGTFNSLPPLPGAQPPEPVASSPQEQLHDEDFDYLAAYYNSGGDDGASTRSSTLR